MSNYRMLTLDGEETFASEPVDEGVTVNHPKTFTEWLEDAGTEPPIPHIVGDAHPLPTNDATLLAKLTEVETLLDAVNTALAAVQIKALDSLGVSTEVGFDNPLQVNVQAPLPAGSNLLGRVTLDADDNDIGNTKDAGAAWVSAYGIAGVTFASADASSAAVCTSAPTAGQKLVITDLIVSVKADMDVTFEEETTGTDKLVLYCKAGAIAQITPRSKLKLDTADKKLTVKASAAGAISVLAFYHSEA